MALSRITKIAPGGSNTFAVAFALGYGNQADVTARVGTEVDGLGAPVYRTINFSVPGFMTLSGATVTAGTPVVFERTENRTTLDVNWLDGANITDDNLNAAQLQYMRLIHEALDGRFEGVTQDLDMAVHQIHNVVDPTSNQDVATKYYVDQRIITGSTAASAAAASAAAALASQGAAATSATNSATSATNATTQYNLAVGQVTIATAQAGLASGYRTDSLTYSNNSAASAVLAQKWANELEDVVVAGGLYSAYHWAQKAAAVVAGGFLSAFHASPSKATPADTDELPIWNSVGGVIGKLTWANLVATVLGAARVFTSTLGVNGIFTQGTANAFGQVVIGSSAIEIGQNRTADGAALIDFHAANPDSDFVARIIRNSGANASFVIQNVGTGGITITNNATSLTMNAATFTYNGGNVLLGNVDTLLAAVGMQLNTPKAVTLSGTVTPVIAGGNFQSGTNGAAFTLAADATANVSFVVTLMITNNGTAGAITISGFSNTDYGDTFDTTNGSIFMCTIIKVGATKVLLIKKVV